MHSLLGFRVSKPNNLFSIHLETVVSMDATCCFTRHIQTRNDLASLVNAFGIHSAFQTAHAVVDHRGDDSDIEGLGSHLDSNSIGPPKHNEIENSVTSRGLVFWILKHVLKNTSLGTINNVMEELLATSSLATGFIPRFP